MWVLPARIKPPSNSLNDIAVRNQRPESSQKGAQHSPRAGLLMGHRQKAVSETKESKCSGKASNHKASGNDSGGLVLLTQLEQEASR